MSEAGGADGARWSFRSGERPVVTVLCAGDRPPDIGHVESGATVRYTTAQRLSDDLAGADALFVWDFLSTAVEAAWPAADRLRWVHIASAGVDRLLFPELRASSVVLTNSRGIFEGPIAEYVLGLVIAFAKGFATTVDDQRRHRWRHRETERIADRHVLVIGTGPIGRATARLLRATGMRVEGIGRREVPADPDFGTVHGMPALAERLGQADYVVAVAPLTDQTRGMFNRDTLAAMRPTARLINVGRGQLVVTDDLVKAIEDGTIAGAALDVFDIEPLGESSPLWSLPGVLVSPHMSGDAVGWRAALAELFVANFLRWQTGEPLHNVVDKQLGYVPGSGASQT
ncbi:MAG TPA: D-2-hydroxyacid dehydrogenase [Pseudonocardiaceae bacterium]